MNDLLGGAKADAAFIDGGHDAFTAMHDYVNYGALLRDDGLAMFHDSLWEGSEEYKGVADALCEIDRLDPGNYPPPAADDQAEMAPSMVWKGLDPDRRAVSTVDLMAASASAAHLAR